MLNFVTEWIKRLTNWRRQLCHQCVSCVLSHMCRNLMSGVIQSNDKPPHEMTRLIQVLLGMSQPSAQTQVADLTFFDTTLNPSQKEAVKFALEAPEVACIHGPPGIYIAFLTRCPLSIGFCHRDRKNTYPHRDNPTADKRHPLKSKTATFTGLWRFQPLS
jgi:hypothetical protein